MQCDSVKIEPRIPNWDYSTQIMLHMPAKFFHKHVNA